MKGNKGYLIKEGVRGIFLHGFMSFAAVCVTVACLLLVGFAFSITYNANIIVNDLNKTNQVIAYIDLEYPEDKVTSVHTEINRLDNISKADFVDREEAWEDFLADQENPEEFAGVEISKILEHRVVVTLTNNRLLDETVKQIEGIAGVSEVKASHEMAENFSALEDGVRILSLVLIGILLVVSLLIISNTVKLAMYDRKEEIAIMKMVGATNGFIRLPFIVEGFVLGMFSACLAFGLEWLLYDTLAAEISMGWLQFVSFKELLGPMIATFAGAGLFVGVLGSWASIRKFMDV
jgi:cell division transport system permease protein